MAESSDRTVVLLNGGQQDIGSENDSAATVLADMESYADTRRAAGWDYVVAYTVPHSTGYTGPQETVRAALNAAILTSTHWDAVVDLAAIPSMQDASNLTYFSDGTHPTAAGALVMANATIPVLETLLDI